MKEKHLLTRKDIAEAMDVSADQVRKNEKPWGIAGARRDLNKRNVRYLASVVWPVLRAKGYIQ